MGRERREDGAAEDSEANNKKVSSTISIKLFDYALPLEVNIIRRHSPECETRKEGRSHRDSKG